MSLFKNARLSAGIVLGVAAVTAPLASISAPASASTPGPNTPESVASGINVASLPGASVFGSTPADTPETVSFVLREQSFSHLETQVEAGVRNYLSVSQFASIYGQTPANISALTSYLAHYGIATDVYADDVDVVATGTAGDFDNALSVQQRQYHVPQQPGSGGLARYRRRMFTASRSRRCCRTGSRTSCWRFLGSQTTARTPATCCTWTPASSSRRQAAQATAWLLSACPTRATCRRASPLTTTSTACTARVPTGPARPSRSSPWPRSTLARRVPVGAAVLLEQHRAHRTDRHPYGGQRRRRAGRTELRLGIVETDLDLEQSGAAGSGRERDRLPGAQHRLRVRRRVLHRGQPEHRKHRFGELGGVRDLPGGGDPGRPGGGDLRGRVR